MYPPDASPLVQTAWLADHLDHPDVQVGGRAVGVPGTRPGRGISADDEAGYLGRTISPGRSSSAWCATSPTHRATCPTAFVPPASFAQVMERLGIGNHTLVMAYDDMVLPLSAARLWWALSYYGHARVRVLDGGLRRWRAEGRPCVYRGIGARRRSRSPHAPRPDWLATKAVGRRGARSTRRGHRGLSRSGSVPRQRRRTRGVIVRATSPAPSTSPTWRTPIPRWQRRPPPNATACRQPSKCCRTLPPDELAALYAAAGVTPDREVIAYCGRGFAAASGLLALKLLGYERVRLYDGSWAEWSADPAPGRGRAVSGRRQYRSCYTGRRTGATMVETDIRTEVEREVAALPEEEVEDGQAFPRPVRR